MAITIIIGKACGKCFAARAQATHTRHVKVCSGKQGLCPEMSTKKAAWAAPATGRSDLLLVSMECALHAIDREGKEVHRRRLTGWSRAAMLRRR